MQLECMQQVSREEVVEGALENAGNSSMHALQLTAVHRSESAAIFKFCSHSHLPAVALFAA